MFIITFDFEKLTQYLSMNGLAYLAGFSSTEVENKVTCDVVTMPPTTVKTLKLYNCHVALVIGHIIAKEMHESFQLMSDKWTYHFVVCVWNSERYRRCRRCTTVRWLRVTWITSRLCWALRQEYRCVGVVVGDNCATNQIFATVDWLC